jgi:predicted transcriptional regulator
MDANIEHINLLKKVAEDVEYIKMVLSESKFRDSFLTREEEKEIEETLKQREKGELLTIEDVFK